MPTHKNFSAFEGTVSQIFPKEKVVNLTVLTAEDYWTKEGEKKTTFSYVPLVAFGHEANKIKSLGIDKGDLVVVFAKTGTNMYEKEGKKIYTTQVVITSVSLSKKKDGGNGATKGEFSEDALSLENVPF